MAKWEVCRITVWEGTRKKTGMFSSDYAQPYKWIAVLETMGGPKTIFETSELSYVHYDPLNINQTKIAKKEQQDKVFYDLRSKLVGNLLADGWEPISADERGNATSFRRQVSD